MITNNINYFLTALKIEHPPSKIKEVLQYNIIIQLVISGCFHPVKNKNAKQSFIIHFLKVQLIINWAWFSDGSGAAKTVSPPPCDGLPGQKCWHMV